MMKMRAKVSTQGAMQVPAKAHFIWTGPGFGLCQRLAVESLVLTNPGYEVILHLIPEADSGKGGGGGSAAKENEELRRLRGRRDVRVWERTAREIIASGEKGDALWQTYQRIPEKAASAKSNLLRYAILWREGGIYLDLDVLVVRSLEQLRRDECSLGNELVWRADEARVAGELAAWMIPPATAFGAAIALRRMEMMMRRELPPGWHRWLERKWSQAQPNNAVIAAAPEARFIGALLERAPQVDATVRFRLGPTLVTEVAREMKRREPARVTLLPPEIFYFVPPSQSFRFFGDKQLALPSEALLIHYVSSNHRRELGEVARGGLEALPPSLFRHLAEAVRAGRAPLASLT